MKDKIGIQQAYDAKARQLFRSMRAICDVMSQGHGVLDLTAADMAHMRAHIAQATQSFHEMNAYRNTLLTT